MACLRPLCARSAAARPLRVPGAGGGPLPVPAGGRRRAQLRGQQPPPARPPPPAPPPARTRPHHSQVLQHIWQLDFSFTVYSKLRFLLSVGVTPRSTRLRWGWRRPGSPPCSGAWTVCTPGACTGASSGTSGARRGRYGAQRTSEIESNVTVGR